MESSETTFRTLSGGQTVSVDEINAVIARVWRDLQQNPDAAAEIGFISVAGPAPLKAQREAGGSEVTSLVIAIATPLAKDALEAVWKTYIWPMIQAKFGAKVRQNGEPG